MRIADTTFGLDRYAWALLAVLSTWEPDFAAFNEKAQMYDVRLHTNVYRLGDQDWAMLSMTVRPLGLRKVIAFGRGSLRDEIEIKNWEPIQDHGVLASTRDLEDADISLHRFEPAELMRAAAFIRDELARAYPTLAQA